MPSEIESRIKELFQEAAELEPAQRDLFLKQNCEDGETLRRVEQLLKHDELRGSAFLRGAAGTPTLSSSLPAGQTIGPYHLLEQIGEGGMGTVYKAEQRHPLRRTVAVKLIRLGFDSQDIIARFDAERQVLAMMDHPNIAKVLEAGATESRRPYFVLEYVPGAPITKFADDHRLSMSERLELFLQVCDGIAHAHTKAIIHRDIKASNVLAFMRDGKPAVKVIDFGIAKALGGRLSDLTLQTTAGSIVGSYESMSPEQADGSPDIDTRTDVYSLGVLLYELISGSKPFDRETLRQSSDHEIRRMIREVDPPRPSTRFSSLDENATRIATLRQTQPQQLARQLHRELEWIPLMALRKPRQRRYASVQQLAEDVNNYLCSRPLIAGPESKSYRAGKFFKRHRLPVCLATAAIFCLIGGLFGTTLGMKRAREAQHDALIAKQAAEDALLGSEQVRKLLTGALTETDPATHQGKIPLVTDLLARTAPRIEQELGSRPLAAAEMLAVVAAAYTAIGQRAEAIPYARRAVELRRAQLGPHHPLTLESEQLLGFDLVEGHHFPEGRAVLDELYPKLVATRGSDDPITLKVQMEWGNSLGYTGEVDRAIEVIHDCLRRRRSVLGTEHPDVLMNELTLGGWLRNRGNPPEVGTLFRHALDSEVKARGPKTPLAMLARYQLATHLSDYDMIESQRLHRETMTLRLEVLGPDHIETVMSHGLLGQMLAQRGELAEAETLLSFAIEHGSAALGADSSPVFIYRGALADTISRAGRHAEAEVQARSTLERAIHIFGESNPGTADPRLKLAMILLRAGKPADAEPLARQAWTMLRQDQGLGLDQTQAAQLLLARCLIDLDRIDEARALATEVRDFGTQNFGEKHRHATDARALLEAMAK